jgi:glycosyltransferase involved in cell wall biosynthesis
MRVGIDLEQFVQDPYGSGIQRVLQYLALTWPAGDVEPVFVATLPGSPRGEFIALSAAQAANLLSIPFAPPVEQTDGDRNVVAEVRAALLGFEAPVLRLSQVMASCHVWFLPEVTYLPSVLDRFALMSEVMPTLMIGYDTFPLTAPANYRFRPGTAAKVNGYFHALAKADSVVCISEFARQCIWDRLRRDRALPCTVAHPGGDHVQRVEVAGDPTLDSVVRFVRLGTMEARKHPVEIVEAFCAAIDSGVKAELLFIGRASASDSAINNSLNSAINAGYPIRWEQDASDSQVRELVAESDVFLSIGIEGYGIPVLEALQLSTPVLYWGVQPAAELMEDAGARSIESPGESLQDSLATAFSQYCDRGRVNDLRGEISLGLIPEWSDFTGEIALAAKKLLT